MRLKYSEDGGRTWTYLKPGEQLKITVKKGAAKQDSQPVDEATLGRLSEVLSKLKTTLDRVSRFLHGNDKDDAAPR